MNKSKNVAKMNRSNSRNRSNYNRNQKAKVPDKEPRMEDIKHSYNDVNWYVPNQEMLKSTASISFENAVGDANIVGNTRIPGIYAVDLALAFGDSKDAISPLNLCARQAYSKLMTGVTSYAPFESNDYMIYLLALDSIYSEFNAIKRAYGILRHFEYKNKYTPEALFAAMGLNFEDWKSNQSHIWFKLNYWANQISKFAVPQIMNVFIRHSWVSTNLYKDGSNDKNQMYIFNPSVIYTYALDTDNNIPYLKSIDSGFGVHRGYQSSKGLSNWADVEGIMDKLIETINEVQDFDVISSYILKQYSNNLFVIGQTPADYEVSAVYDESVLLQIHNATNYNPASTDTFSIRQVVDADKGLSYLKANPSIDVVAMTNYDLYVDLMDKEAEPNVIMESTRLIATCTGAKSDKGTGTLDSFGGDVVYRTGIVLFNGAPNEAASLQVVSDFPTYTLASTLIKDAATFKKVALRSKFNYAPSVIVTEAVTGVTPNTERPMYTLGDLGNYQVVHSTELATMNNVAMMGLLGLI